MGAKIDNGVYDSGKVSAVIVSYNQAAFISETIESVLSQTYENIEIVVADDGSTDGTQEIISRFVQKHPAKFRVALNAENTGIASNFNRALDLCSGEFIAWLGGDDLWLPSKIEKQVAYMRTHLDVTGCHTDGDVFISDSGASLGRFSEVYGRGAEKLPEGGVEVVFDELAPMFPSSIMLRSEVTQGYYFDERLKVANDRLFHVEVLRTGKVGAIRESLGRYRRHNNNITGNDETNKVVLEETMVFLAIISIRYPELFPLIKASRSKLYLIQMIKAFKNGEADRAWACLRTSLREGHKIKSLLIYVALSLGLYRMLDALKGNRRFMIFASKFLGLPLADPTTVKIKRTKISGK